MGSDFLADFVGGVVDDLSEQGDEARRLALQEALENRRRQWSKEDKKEDREQRRSDFVEEHNLTAEPRVAMIKDPATGQMRQRYVTDRITKNTDGSLMREQTDEGPLPENYGINPYQQRKLELDERKLDERKAGGSAPRPRAPKTDTIMVDGKPTRVIVHDDGKYTKIGDAVPPAGSVRAPPKEKDNSAALLKERLATQKRLQSAKLPEMQSIFTAHGGDLMTLTGNTDEKSVAQAVAAQIDTYYDNLGKKPKDEETPQGLPPIADARVEAQKKIDAGADPEWVREKFRKLYKQAL